MLRIGTCGILPHCYTIEMMDMPPASMRELARRLLAVEAACPFTSSPNAHEAVRVCEKLRVSLTRFAGADGIKSLLQRSLVMARAEVPALHDVKLASDGTLEGLENLVDDPSRDAEEAATAITKHLLGLLVTFVGKPITLKLVREAWPDASFDE